MIDRSQVTFTGGARVSTETISIVSDNSTEEREEFIVALESFTLIHSGNGSALEVSEQEQPRLILRPSTAMITILDDDGKSAAMIFKTIKCLFTSFSYCHWLLQHNTECHGG